VTVRSFTLAGLVKPWIGVEDRTSRETAFLLLNAAHGSFRHSDRYNRADSTVRGAFMSNVTDIILITRKNEHGVTRNTRYASPVVPPI
jgi:hypothetical protein